MRYCILCFVSVFVLLNALKNQAHSMKIPPKAAELDSQCPLSTLLVPSLSRVQRRCRSQGKYVCSSARLGWEICEPQYCACSQDQRTLLPLGLRLCLSLSHSLSRRRSRSRKQARCCCLTHSLRRTIVLRCVFCCCFFSSELKNC